MRRNLGVKTVTWLMAASMFLGGIPSPASIVHASEDEAAIEYTEDSGYTEEAYAEPETYDYSDGAAEETYSEPVYENTAEPEYQEPEVPEVPAEPVYTEPVYTEPVVETPPAPVVEQPVEQPAVQEPEQPVVIEEPAAAEEAAGEEEEDPEDEEEIVEEIEEPKVNEITITYQAGEGGYVTRGSETIDLNNDESRPQGSTAKADGYRYRFVQWSNGSTDETLVSDKSGISDDVAYTAEFERLVKNIQVVYSVSPADGGYVVPNATREKIRTWTEEYDVWSGNYQFSGAAAEAEEGYEFVGWSASYAGGIILTDASIVPEINEGSSFVSFTEHLDEQITFTAQFEKVEEAAKDEETEKAEAADDEDVMAEEQKDAPKAGAARKSVTLTAVGDELTEGEAKDGSEEEEELSEEEEEEGPTRETEDTYTVTFYDRDAEVYSVVEVNKGSAIGTLPAVIARDDYISYWAIGEIVEGGQGSEIRVTGARIDGSFVPEGDTIIVPDFEKVSYTVSFYENEDDTEAYATRTVDVDSSFYLNDIPAVPTRNGYTSKWVYSGGDFSNTVAISADTKVWAEYDKNVFTVTFIANGKTYQTDTYYKNDTLSLPVAPVVDGKEFKGWFFGETEYTGGEAITSDLELTAAFSDMLSVHFVVPDESGEPIETLSRYFTVAEGEAIGTMPEDPFVAGRVFEKWVKQGTDEEVTAATVVTESFTAVAVFRDVHVYTINVTYFYDSKLQSGEVEFEKQIIQVDEDELPYTITAPSSTSTDPEHVEGGIIYYPETPTKEVVKDDFENYTCYVRIKFVEFTAIYSFVYKLKDLTGDGYSEIDRQDNIEGVKGSFVTPTVKNFEYAVLERAEGATITEEAGQELFVYYTRKNYQLTYETNGGSYVGGTTAPYGSTVTLSTTKPTREGYTFDSWYLDKELTQPAGTSVVLEGNTTVYAKWNPARVNYTIVYMLEKYNDTGTASSYVYDSSSDATGQVGTVVSASTAPALTRTGWEADTARNAESSVTIAADGSSVLFVYYKLREYTLTFDRNGRGSIVKPDGSTTTSTYSFGVKLGQDISGLWPSATSTSRYFVGWQKNGQGTNYTTKQLIMNTDLLPTSGTNLTFYAHWESNAVTRTVNYYLENADDDGYTRSEMYSQTYTSTGGTLNPKVITGYTYDHSQNSGNTYNFYYKRDKYNIDYYYGSTKLNTIENVKFDANINRAPYVWTPTAAQCGVESDYSFDGWYSDSGLTTKYTFTTMPASNLVLYAKWNAPKFTVTFEMDGGTPEEPSQSVSKYNKAEKPTNPTKTGYTFEGWFTSADGTELFDWNTQIVKDTTIYAHWSQDPLRYTVRYVDEEGNAVAAEKIVTNPNFVVGQTIEEIAVTVAGMRPDEGNKSIELQADPSKNIITFIYSTKSGKTKYTVKYFIDPSEAGENEIAVAAEKTKEVDGDTLDVIELAASVDYAALYAAHPELNGIEFFPDEVEKRLVLGTDESKNVLTFYYSRYQSAKVTVHFVDMDGQSIADDDSQMLKVGKSYTLERTPVSGWEVSKAVVGTGYGDPEAGTSYTITDTGTLEFTIFYKKKLTITAVSLSKSYDGNVLTLPAALADQVEVEGLKDGHSLSSVGFSYVNNDSTAPMGRLAAGVATVTPADAVITGPTNSDYYIVRYISGTLTVTQLNVTVRIEPDRWTGNIYDGVERKTGFTNGSKGIADYILISHEGYRDAYLEAIWNIVKSLPNVKQDSSAPGLGYYVISEKNVGDYSYNLDIKASDLPNDNGNYSVALYVRPGRLQILPVEATVTTSSDSKAYDGTPLTNAEASITGLAAADEGIVKVTADGTITDPGTTTNTYSIDWGTVNPNNYSIVKEELGTLEITKRKVTLTSATDEKYYDGTALTNNKVTVGGDGFVGSDGATYDVTGSQTEVGSSANTFTYTLNEGTKADNYEITTVEGTLTVKAVTDEIIVTITENSGSEKYDGKEKTVTGYTVSISNPLYTEKDFTFSGNDTVKGTDAGSYDMELKPEDFVNKNESFSNVKFMIVDGTLEIAKRTVTLTSADDEKVYDGKALTNDKITEGGDGFVEGEGATYDVTGSQTEVGESKNTFSYTLNEGTKAGNYDITKVEGTLKVTASTDKVTVTITENSGSEKYDGEEKEVKGYKVDIDNELYTENDFTFSGNDTVTGTDAGSYDMELKAADFTNISKNFSDVEFVIVDGKLEITKRSVTLTSASGEKVYDGTALTNNKVTESGDGFAEGEGATYNVTGTQTEVGSSANAFTYTLNEGTKAGNYDITKVEGTLTITELTDKVTVTITENSGSEKYDGTEKTVTGYEVTSISNSLYTEKDFTFSGNDTVKGTDAGSYDMELKESDFTNTNENFSNVEFVIVDGTLEIAKRTVTLTSADDEKVYDGQPLTNGTVTVSGDGFVNGEGASYDVTGTQTEAGSSANAFTYTLNEGTKADNYDISKVEGTLTVTALTDEVTVTITEHSGSEKYDGTEKKATGYDVAISNPLYTEGDFTFSGDATVKGTDAGSYEMKLKAADFENTSKNFSNVKFVIVDGTLEIAKREITLTSATEEKVYDGEPLTNDEITVGGDGFAEGEGATYDVTGSQTDVGSSANAFTYELNEGTKADNYEISKEEGTLTVTPVTDKVTVTITENSGSEKYDGEEKEVKGYKVDIDNELYTEKDFTFDGNDIVKGTDAGTYEMELKAADFTNISKNFTNVEFVIVDGTLEIAKREVTLTSATDKKVYDSKPLTNDEIKISGDGFVEGEGATYDVTGSQTEVGESDNTFTYKLNEGTKADNYEIKTVFGTLTVTEFLDEVKVTITENSGKEKYDGTEKKVTGYTVEIDNELYTEGDFEFSGDATVKGTDAGTYNMELRITDFENKNKNFSKVNFIIVDGKLEIEKRTVTLTSADDEKVYDGEALTNDEIKVSEDGFAEGEGAAYDVTGSQTDVGESDNTFTYELNEGTKADNYEITTKEGTLKVTPVTDKVTVTITENSGSEKYDGTEKTVEGYEVTSISNELYTEDDFEFGGDATVKGTDAGSYEMELKPEDFENISENFTNVEFVIVDGTLEIAKRTVTLTSATDEKVYDGQPLTNDEVTVGGDGFAEGEGASYDVTGSQTNVGSSSNTFTYALNEGTKADNYEITTAEGTLTVTPFTDKVTVTIKGNTGSETYDGTEKTVEGYEVTSISNELYTEEDFSFSGDDSVSGTNAGTYYMGLEEADFENISENFTNVEFVVEDGRLTIDPAKVTVTADDNSKIYGEKDPELTAKVEGLVEGDSEDLISYSISREEGENVGSYVITPAGEAEQGNYAVTYVNGEFTITAASITKMDVSQPEDVIYNGQDQKQPVTVTDSRTGEVLEEGKDYELTYSDDVKNVGEVTITVKGIGNYEDTVTRTYNILKRPLKIRTDSASKLYDGTALTANNPGYTLEGLVAGETVKVTVTGSQTDAGSSPNTYTLEWADGKTEAKEANNLTTKAYAAALAGEDTGNAALSTNYDLTEEVGTLTVNKRNVILTSGSASKYYDGTALTNNTVEIGGDGFAKNEGAAFNVTGTITAPGSTENAFTYTLNSNTKAANYNITTRFGTLRVTAVPGPNPTPDPTPTPPTPPVQPVIVPVLTPTTPVGQVLGASRSRGVLGQSRAALSATTGDEGHAAEWFGISFASAFAILSIIVLILKKKEKEEKENKG